MTTLVEDIEFEKKLKDAMIKTIEELIMSPQRLMAKELSSFSLRIKKQEEKLGEIIERIEKLESKVMEESFLDRLLS